MFVLLATSCLVAVAFPAASFGLATSEANVELDESRVNPCNDETVTLEGRIHLLFVFSATHVETHTNWQGVQGIGDQGNLYRASEETRVYIAERPPGDVFVIRFQDERTLVSQGSSPNYVQIALIEITFGPGGATVTTRMTEHCSGTTPP
jgi:hypothetical protein